MSSPPLRVLILERDSRLCALLRSTLEGEGFSVQVVQSLAEVRGQGAARPAVALVDVTLLDSADAASFRGLLPVGTSVLLSTAGSSRDPGVLRLQHELSAVEVLAKPFSLFDLADTIRQHAAPRAQADPLAGLTRHIAASQGSQAPSAIRNAVLLAQLWARRRSGTLVLAAPSGLTRFSLSVGGVEGAEAWVAVQRALAGDGQLRFEAGSGSQLGDWAGLGAAIYSSAGDLRDREQGPVRGHLAVVSAPEPEVWQALPLPPEARALLKGAHSNRSLEAIAAQAGVSLTAALEPLRRLQVLGLLQLASAPSLHPTSGRSGIDPDSPTFTGRAPSPDDPTWTAATPPRPAPRSDARTTLPGRTRARSAGSSAPPRSRSVSNHSETSDFLSRRSRRKQDQVLHNRLESELGRLKDATPWVVLGVPQEAPPDLMKESASRQRRRYRHLSGRADLPDETRALGRALAALVDDAEKAVVSGSAASLQGSAEDLDLLAAGRRRIAAGAWAQADRVLTRARDLSMSDPEVLANLGWARLHNPERARDARIEEGRDLLLLAEQLAPAVPEILGYTGEFFLMQGDVDRARTRAKLLIKADPASRAGKDLLARCEAATPSR